MKLINYITSLPILLVALLAMISCPVNAQVYKVVDEDGNVTYTDQAPGDGSQPIELRPISVIEAPTYVKPEKPAEEDVENPGRNQTPETGWNDRDRLLERR